MIAPDGSVGFRERSGDPAPLHRARVRRDGVRQQLRAATAGVHEALHHHPGFVGLLEQRMTRLGYRALLARLYGFHRPLERGLRAAPPEVLQGLDLRACARWPALRGDLRVLGLSRNEIDALPVCEGLPPVRSRADLLGRLYVIEGSALGGRVMASRLDGILGCGEAKGRQFLAGRPAPDPLPWPVLCQLLEARAADSDINALIESAGMTFGALALWLNEGEVDV